MAFYPPTAGEACLGVLNLADLSFACFAGFLSLTTCPLPSAASSGTPSARRWRRSWPSQDATRRTGRVTLRQGMGEGRRRHPELWGRVSACTIRNITDTLHCIQQHQTLLRDCDPLAHPARRRTPCPAPLLLNSLRMASHHRATAGSSWATSSVSNWGQPATAKETLVAYIGTGAASTSGVPSRFSTLIGGLSSY